MVKNCDQGLENAALSLRRDVYQHTDIYQHTDLPAGNNNIYIYIYMYLYIVVKITSRNVFF